jgi:ABC-type multidrug transport system fused ATPase/permease subunit
MGKPAATETEMISALGRVGLSIHNSTDLPNGLETQVSATSGLSMGQRRRIALARALLQNRPIFILDEPTASLDQETEKVVNEAIQELVSEGKCVIAVAHRPHLVVSADQVIEIIEPQLMEPVS